jgi:diaminopimelate epimerase
LDNAPKETNNLGQYRVTLSNNNSIDFSFINIGNPHAVIFSEDIASDPLILWGDDLQQSKYFPNGVNLSLASIKNKEAMHMRIYERGVGETMACGSGACAAVMAGIEQGYLNHKVSVIFKNGTLNVSYNQSNNIIEVIGSANYLGEIYT